MTVERFCMFLPNDQLSRKPFLALICRDFILSVGSILQNRDFSHENPYCTFGTLLAVASIDTDCHLSNQLIAQSHHTLTFATFLTARNAAVLTKDVQQCQVLFLVST